MMLDYCVRAQCIVGLTASQMACGGVQGPELGISLNSKYSIFQAAWLVGWLSGWLAGWGGAGGKY